jgi:Asp-tRNA(Asn)/Glu-tRNA(Gln) amidotransferase A subunit family amidase
VVDLLIREGCVPFAHSNVPQGLFNILSSNYVWGISQNPYKKGFISGGSSGG